MSSSTPRWLQDARDHWSNRGTKRPDFAIEPGPDQESVWDYPRPPAVVADTRLVEVRSGGQLVASTTASLRILETSHPPTFYVPPESVTPGVLSVVAGSSHCEWKGKAQYLAVTPDGGPVGWRYPTPYEEFAQWAGYVAFYPAEVDCFVDGEAVRPQEGGFYGGWITDDVVGPFKGSAGSTGW